MNTYPSHDSAPRSGRVRVWDALAVVLLVALFGTPLVMAFFGHPQGVRHVVHLAGSLGIAAILTTVACLIGALSRR